MGQLLLLQAKETAKPLEKRSIVCGFWRALRRYWGKFSSTWPRTVALVFGVVGTMLLLEAIAIFFGLWLADMEARPEIEHNNEVIAVRAEVAQKANFLNNVSLAKPCICLSIFVGNETVAADFDLT